MAALVAGVQYGLSSHSNFHENKSLIFVKLTDSAQRAIEDFLRNRGSETRCSGPGLITCPLRVLCFREKKAHAFTSPLLLQSVDTPVIKGSNRYWSKMATKINNLKIELKNMMVNDPCLSVGLLGSFTDESTNRPGTKCVPLFSCSSLPA
ncbi:hypothetical protein WN48_08304 [Eufriesea mexicana]|uniref:RNA polymerase II elongation factor ELL N-terminal domain-containing protein n=1 Tax=Eufriesea mexicana TaxID=516756 RepID=A0A310SBF4_9HYME|nr:hypothetical protein WN48_08304 [Eufriesea mexicana]